MNNKIEVTVVTGFLGAGKTTFINSILQHNRQIQFALVENEFGDVAIDTELIKGVDASQMFELKQGCICCTIVDEYELVLAELAERFQNLQHLIIETTGVADPIPVIRPFYSNRDLQAKFTVNGTYCIVDALNFSNGVEKEITQKQIAVADEIIVTKSEKLTESALNKLIKSIQLINSTAKIAQFNDFEFNAIKIKKSLKFIPDNIVHHHAIQTKTLTFHQSINKFHFQEWLSYTLTVFQLKIYRCKGFISFEGELYQCILQGVGGGYELLEGENLLENETSQIVFIGKLDEVNLDYDCSQSP